MRMGLRFPTPNHSVLHIGLEILTPAQKHTRFFHINHMLNPYKLHPSLHIWNQK